MANDDKAGGSGGGDRWPGAVKFFRKIGKSLKTVKDDALKAGKEDPRKLIHSIKVGLALTLASLLYLLEPVFDGLGQNSIWAVITVIVVLEFTAGATLYKGINRGLGTLFAISLAFLIQLFVSHIGHIGRAICIGISVFIVGALTTYARLIPSIQKHSDYGLVVFALTFNMITVGSYHDSDMLGTATQRLYAIGIGCVICLVASLLLLPNWSGEELHRSMISKFEDLAKLVQACVDEYFQDMDKQDAAKSLENSSFDNKYEGVLKLKAAEFALATFASWEPRHSRYSYPWKQYAHLGVELQHLGYTAVALHGCLESQIQAPRPVRAIFREPCKHVADEVVHVLNELAETIKTHHLFSPHISDHLHEALQELDASISTQPQLLLFPNSTHKPPSICPVGLLAWQGSNKGEQQKDINVNVTKINRTKSKTVITQLQFSEALSLAAFVSLLMETVARLELLVEEVEELGKIAHFKEFHVEEEEEEEREREREREREQEQEQEQEQEREREREREIEIVINNSENGEIKQAVADSGNNPDVTKFDLEAQRNLEKRVEICCAAS